MLRVQPTNFITRCSHYRTLQAEGALFLEQNGAALVENYGRTVGQEVTQAKQLSIADLSVLPRTGFKGRESIQWGQSQGLEIGRQNNRAYLQNNSMLIARLADTEILALNALSSKKNQCASFDEKYQRSNPRNCYSVPRFNLSAWFLITGKYASEMFAKMCGVDLRLNKFINGAIAQTSVARMNAIIIRNDIKDTPAFNLIFDNASTDYLWSCFKDVFVEFGGAPIGYAAILKLWF